MIGSGARREIEGLVARAGTLALGHFRRVSAERKADRSLVTRADREVEAYLAAELSALMPEAGIIAEEGTTRPSHNGTWLAIDPIDGTAAFVAGLSTWCV